MEKYELGAVIACLVIALLTCRPIRLGLSSSSTGATRVTFSDIARPWWEGLS